VARFIGYEGARRYADYIEKLTGDQEIVPPGITLETDPLEARYLKRVRHWSSRATVAAAVGNRGKMQLTNPANSQAIVVVLGMGQIQKPSVDGVFVTGDAAAAGGGISPANGLDSRIPLDNTGVLAVQPPQSTISNAAGGVSGFFIDQVTPPGANQDAHSKVLPVLGFILTPGHNITITDNTLNEAATFMAWGYTRPVRPEELAL